MLRPFRLYWTSKYLCFVLRFERPKRSKPWTKSVLKPWLSLHTKFRSAGDTARYVTLSNSLYHLSRSIEPMDHLIQLKTFANKCFEIVSNHSCQSIVEASRKGCPLLTLESRTEGVAVYSLLKTLFQLLGSRICSSNSVTNYSFSAALEKQQIHLHPQQSTVHITIQWVILIGIIKVWLIGTCLPLHLRKDWKRSWLQPSTLPCKTMTLNLTDTALVFFV